MGARLPPLLLLALLAGSAARVHARCINDNQQGSVLSASKVHGRPVEQPGCACKPQEPECKCDVIDQPDTKSFVAISVPGAAPSPRAARLATATGTGLDGQLVFGEARRVLDPGQELFGDAPNEITNSQPAAISDANAFEFGVRGVQNQWFVHFTSQGRVTLTLVVDAIITSIVNTFRSEAFVGLGPLQEVSNNASVTATFMNDTLTVSQRLTWPVLRVGPAGTVVLYQAVYELYSQCVPGPLAPCCHTNGTFKTGDVCRAKAGLCDIEEQCAGNNATCPEDTFVAQGKICREKAGPCDVEEQCTGNNATCPEDNFVSQGTVCRSAVTVTVVRHDTEHPGCHIRHNNERMPGICNKGYKGCNADLPDVIQPCDAPDVCNGTGPSCPDTFEPDGTPCPWLPESNTLYGQYMADARASRRKQVSPAEAASLSTTTTKNKKPPADMACKSICQRGVCTIEATPQQRCCFTGDDGFGEAPGGGLSEGPPGKPDKGAWFCWD